MRWGVKNSLAKIKEPKRSKLFEFAKKLKFMCETARDASHGSRHTAHARRHGRTSYFGLRDRESHPRPAARPVARRGPPISRAQCPQDFTFSSQMHTSQHVYEYFTYVAPLCRARLLLYTTCDMQPIQCSPSPLDEGAPGRKILGPRRHPHGGAAWACSTPIGTATIGWAITVAMTADWAVPGWIVCIWVPTAGPSTLLGTLAALHAATA
eukprot:scaffold78525_cov63-Phaeocystis_antarctica.AAC.6